MRSVELAGCLVTDAYGRYLLLHRNFRGNRQWELPGGKVVPDEMPEQTAQRECKEELNIEVVVLDLLVTIVFREYDINYSYQVFSGIIRDSVPVVNEKDKFDAVAYFSLDELNSMYENLSITMKLVVKTLNPPII